MRDQGGGMLVSSSVERKKVSVKLSGKEDGNEGARKRAGYGSESNYGHGGATKFTGNVLAAGAGKQKGGSLISSGNAGSRQHNEELHLEHLLPAAKASDEGLNLPQWGRGKRTRCSRPEPSAKLSSSSPVQESSKSASPTLKKPLPNGAPSSKLRSHGQAKLPPIKFTASDGPVSRNGFINKSVNGSVQAGAFNSVRQVAEAKEKAFTQQRRSTDGSSGRHQQSDVAASNHGRGHGTGNVVINDGVGTSGMFEVNAGLDYNKAKIEWPRITLALTRKEKEEDFLIFKGTKLPQRPKKRLKAVEKVLLFCTPGNWLGDLSRGRYDVREKKIMKKKPSGLKAMDSVESDSE